MTSNIRDVLILPKAPNAACSGFPYSLGVVSQNALDIMPSTCAQKSVCNLCLGPCVPISEPYLEVHGT